ncbi:unnamed protein product [Victoria cruziana]
MERFVPSVAMVVTQFGFAGLNVLSKVAMNRGMNPFVMVTYRQVVAALSTAPIAYFMERKTKMKLTWSTMLQIFFCALFGATLNQGLYFAGLKFVSPTIACALNNLLPAVTFIIAIPFRMETIGVRSSGGMAKILGTAVCVGGAMLMTFYKGPQLNLWSSGVRWDIGYQTSRDQQATTDDRPAGFIIGSVMVVASCFAWAIWFILQAKMSRTFSAPYTSTALLCLVAAVQCGAMTICMERDASAWALGWDIRLLTVVYTGVVGSGMAFCAMSWCIQRRGPLFVSMFSPLVLIIVAFLGWALFDEKLHLGKSVISPSPLSYHISLSIHSNKSLISH